MQKIVSPRYHFGEHYFCHYGSSTLTFDTKAHCFVLTMKQRFIIGILLVLGRLNNLENQKAMFPSFYQRSVWSHMYGKGALNLHKCFTHLKNFLPRPFRSFMTGDGGTKHDR